MFRQFNVLDAPQLRLVEFYGGYRPRAFVASYGNSQAVKFIQPEILYCASDPIGQDDGLAEELSKSSFILGKDCGGVGFHGWHGASYHSVGMIMPR